MSDSKTYVFNPEGSNNALAMLAPMLSNRGMDSATIASMMNGGFGGNNFIWAIFLMFLMGGGYGNGFGGRGSELLSAQMNNNTNRELLQQAINGNSAAIGQLSTNLHVDTSKIEGAIWNVQGSIKDVANSVGMTSQQVINAIQQGNAQISSQFAQACCDVKSAINTQGYENRIANIEQTNILGSKIDAQTTAINEHFAQLEMRELQSKLDSIREENSNLKNQISNLNQNAYIAQVIGNATTPLQLGLNSVRNDVDIMKCAINPVVVPYNPYASPYNGNGTLWS